MVYLIGAGPGDPGLITVKGIEVLRKADIVLYDRLADSNLLLETKPECTLIDAGKSAGKHTKSQEEITNLLIEYSRKGLEVVRLKGGDPFLFGRGGEEAERLSEEGIPFVVIPGVSALYAVATYSGIPLTHRKYASSVGIATGHAAHDKESDPVNWRKMAEAVDTIVVFMGVGNIGTIVREIIAGGLPPQTPAALIERGCTPLQRMVTSTLEHIADDAKREQVTPPALFVVGDSVSLAEKLNWYKPGPLSGIRIGITRPVAQSKSFAHNLRALGATPIPMPTIQIVDRSDTEEVGTVMKKLNSYDFITFSSTNGVEFFFQALKKSGLDSRVLAGSKIAAIGPVTKESCSYHGITADVVAETFTADGLLEAVLSSGPVVGKKFLLVSSDIGRTTVRDGLAQAGALVDRAVFYSTRTAVIRPYIVDMIKKGHINIITFTSASTVEGFFARIPPGERGVTTKIASIGPQTTLALKRYNITPDIEADEYTTAGLTEAILTEYVKE